MSGEWYAQEPAIRLAAFVVVLMSMLGWQAFAPRRPTNAARGVRWSGNLGVGLLNVVIVRLAFPLAAVGLAARCEDAGVGLFNQLDPPRVLAAILGFVALDFVVYLQHRLFHAAPLLWRFHRMHHADLEFDATTGVRFHPVEMLVSLAIKLIVIAALGVTPLAVLVFEIVLNATSLFNHANVRISAMIDRWLRFVVVTPDMHRVHHSVQIDEQNRNFGFNLPWWDRLLGTYRDQPREGHSGMTIGIMELRDPAQLRLDRMLVQPFRQVGGTEHGRL
jgi:sterol desaturase/sphingolipid hydroxylase (fatty acid hydroxylase superfamily)